MAYLVRKVVKRAQLDELKNANDVMAVLADIPTTEFRTTKGTLSTWKAETLEEVDNAVLAIVVTSSKLEKMDFIIIPTELLDKNLLEYRKTDAGKKVAIPELQGLHYDIEGISLEKLTACMQVYQSIVKNEGAEEKYIKRYSAGEIKELLRKEIRAGSVKEELAEVSKDLREAIRNLRKELNPA